MSLLDLIVAGTTAALVILMAFQKRWRTPQKRLLWVGIGASIVGYTLWLAFHAKVELANTFPAAGIRSPSIAGPNQIGAFVSYAKKLGLALGIGTGLWLLLGPLFLIGKHGKSYGAERIRASYPRFVATIFGVAAYMFAAIYPGGLVKQHALQLSTSQLTLFLVVYVSVIIALIALSGLLITDPDTRRSRWIVIPVLVALSVIGAASPMLALSLGTRLQGLAAQTIGLFGIIAMIFPFPVFWLFHNRLRWI